MTIISKIAKKKKNSDVEVIGDIDVNSIYFWLNKKHTETKVGHSKLPVITNKYGPKYNKCRSELADEPKYQPFRRLIRNDLAEKIDPFRRNLGFNIHGVFNN